MSIRLESITLRNPTPCLSKVSSSMALCRAPPAGLGFEPLFGLGFKPLFRAKIRGKLSAVALRRVIGVNLRQRSVRSRTVFSFAASHEESKASDIDIDKENEDSKVQSPGSEEAWQQALASFKEQALKMQSISKEAYESYSEKAIVILKETSEKLKIQAEKASQDLMEIVKETTEESKEYFTTAAENTPEQVKDVFETFASAPDEFKDVSKVRDFYVGIPYGGLLTASGFLSFMLTGSIPAIRFGIVLGGALLALSISSLRSWKEGEPSPLLLKGQTAIATILFLRELRLLSTRSFIANFITTFISGGVVAFYLYRIIRDREQSGGSNLNVEPQT